MMNPYRNILSVLFVVACGLGLHSQILNARITATAICTSTTNGNWNNASTWSCGHVPACGDAIIIAAGTTVSISNQQNYSTCTPTPGMSPQIYVYGMLQFVTGNKLTLPCGSVVYVGATGTVNPGGGSGNSNYIEICTNIVWNAADPPVTGPSALCTPTPCNLSPLPIELIAFTGDLDVKVVFVKWKTATELNNSYYEVEKSSDGINYSVVATVKSKAINGNSNGILEYSITDNELKHPLYYYRLKQVDLDGSFKRTNSITVKIYSPELRIYPNPNNGQFKIEIPTALTNQHVDVKICNQLSQPILDNTYNVINDNITGSVVEIVPAKPLPLGVYFATIVYAGVEYRLKLIVN